MADVFTSLLGSTSFFLLEDKLQKSVPGCTCLASLSVHGILLFNLFLLLPPLLMGSSALMAALLTSQHSSSVIYFIILLAHGVDGWTVGRGSVLGRRLAVDSLRGCVCG